MTPSDALIEFLKHWEDLRLSCYQDSGGHWAIGYGHTCASSQPPVTPEWAEETLREDVAKVGARVDELLSAAVAQCEYDALVSFAFNLGPFTLERSTLLRRVNSQEFDAVPAEFMRWVHVGDRVLPGLKRRRAAEVLMFEHGNYDSRP